MLLLQQDYGGYLALMMLKSTEGLIRCAAAQAPIVDWTMYGEQIEGREEDVLYRRAACVRLK